MFMAHFVFVILSLFIQARTVGRAEAPVENELDTLYLPASHPEYVLAKRALSANGLCPTPKAEDLKTASTVTAPKDSSAIPNLNFLVANCP